MRGAGVRGDSIRLRRGDGGQRARCGTPCRISSAYCAGERRPFPAMSAPWTSRRSTCATCHSFCPDADLPGDATAWIGEIRRRERTEDEAPRSAGQDARDKAPLALCPALHSVRTGYTGEINFRFTVTGFGHGVGMSQYGANVLAQGGAGYREILAHYYPGTTLTLALNRMSHGGGAGEICHCSGDARSAQFAAMLAQDGHRVRLAHMKKADVGEAVKTGVCKGAYGAGLRGAARPGRERRFTQHAAERQCCA